jgi:hypothetical protein
VPRRPAPLLGNDPASVLVDILGLAPAEAEQLIASGICA